MRTIKDIFVLLVTSFVSKGFMLEQRWGPDLTFDKNNRHILLQQRSQEFVVG